MGLALLLRGAAGSLDAGLVRRLGHDPDQTVVRERPDISLVVEGPFTGTVDCCFEHECQNPIFSSALPEATPGGRSVPTRPQRRQR